MTTDIAAELRRIAAAATRIDERMGAPLEPREGVAGSVTAWLDSWRQAAVGGDEAQFARRLAYDGLDEDSACRLLSGVPQVGEVPDWGRLLADAAGPGAAVPPSTDSAPLPFSEILAPLAASALRRLTQPGTGWRRLFADGVVEALNRELLKVLCGAAERALLAELVERRDAEISGLERLLRLARGEPGRDLYERFVAERLETGFLEFCGRHPVLARLLGTLALNWAAHVEEFGRRLEADLPALAARFGCGADPGKVVRARGGLSDLHRGGRSVVVVEFGGGLKTVYKPRGMAPDRYFADLVDWFNGLGPSLDLRAAGMLDRGEYGWAEFIFAMPCTDEEAARRYFRRAGLLLALAYATALTDCHHENLIAAGEHPVLIDLETVLSPELRLGWTDPRSPARRAAERWLRRSVLSTLLLPSMIQAGEGDRDIGGFSGGRDDVPVPGPKWFHINTDLMYIETVQMPGEPSSNLPRLGGAALRIQDHLDSVLDGFDEGYGLLLGSRDLLSGAGGPLEMADAGWIRVLCRDTKFYSLLMGELTHAEFLGDGAAWSARADVLTRRAVDDELPEEVRQPLQWPLVMAERAALSDGDVPLLRAHPGGTDIEVAAGRVIAGALAASGLAGARQHLGSWGEADRGDQSMLIRMAVAMQVVRDQRGVDDGHVAGLAERPLPEGTGVLDGRDALARAQRLADDLWRRSCRGEDGGASWIAAQGHSLTIGPVGPDLYGGSTGIALFFAAVAAAGGREQDRAAALAALAPVRAAISDGLIGALVGHRIGAGSGIGSVAYGLARAAGLLERPDLLDDACRAAALIDDRAIAGDERLDAVDGSAGAVLALLALAGIAGDADGSLRARADRCGRHLLARRRPFRASGARVWSAGGEPVTGLSHGAAGIAYALARLAGATGSTEFLDAAAEAVSWEDEVLIGGIGTWHRMAVAGHDHSRPINSWCHGAAGIGLARLAGLPVLKGPSIEGDIDAAVAAVLGGGLAEVDHPCCGTLGRTELLLNAGRDLARPDLLGEARRIGAALVAAADAEGGFQHYPSLPRSVFNPGFWQGSAGIGYMLLRLAWPERLPSVLVWE